MAWRVRPTTGPYTPDHDVARSGKGMAQAPFTARENQQTLIPQASLLTVARLLRAELQALLRQPVRFTMYQGEACYAPLG